MPTTTNICARATANGLSGGYDSGAIRSHVHGDVAASVVLLQQHNEPEDFHVENSDKQK